MNGLISQYWLVARSVVKILDNDPCDRGSIPCEVILFLKKLEISSAKQGEKIDKELIFGRKPKFDCDEFGITRVRYIEVQLYYCFKLNLFPLEF